MKKVYVNEIWTGDKEVIRGFIVVKKTIDEGLKTLFSERVQNNIQHLINNDPTKKDGFHFFTKFCQFVVYFQYDTKEVVIRNKTMKIGISIELMHFGTSGNVNDAFDYALKLRKSGWGDESRDKILELANQIKNDMKNPDFELAELEVKDAYDDLTTYL